MEDPRLRRAGARSWRLAARRCFSIQKRLQNQGSGNLVYYPAVLLAGMAGFIEDPVRFLGGEALIPQMDRQAGELAQLRGKGLGAGGLRADFAGEMERVANDDAPDGKTASQASQGAEIVP